MEGREDWVCKRCDRRNPRREFECTRIGCHEWRPRKENIRREGDWTCCGETQFASRDKCRRCGKVKSEDNKTSDVADNNNNKVVTFRHGDWLCGECNAHQFANRTECYKCKASRPVREDKDGNEIGNPCVICYAKERNVAFVHGDTGHFVCCKECASKCNTCPMCRQIVSNIINIY